MTISSGVIALIITLTFTNTLSFYFHQFSILLDSVFSFVTLLALQRYRTRFLSPRPVAGSESAAMKRSFEATGR